MKWYLWLCLVLTACHSTPMPQIYTEDRGCEVAIVTQKDRALMDEWISRIIDSGKKLIELPLLMRDAKPTDILITNACYQERIIHPLTKPASLSDVGFVSHLKCTINGNIYQTRNEVASIDRFDRCPVKNEILYSVGFEEKMQSSIIFTSDDHWVMVIIPRWIEGNTGFQYQWGSGRVYFHGIASDIEYGRVMKG